MLQEELLVPMNFYGDRKTQKYLHQIQTLLHQHLCHSEDPLRCPIQVHPHAHGRHLSAISLAESVCVS